MIRIEAVTMQFGGIKALDDVSLKVEPGELFSIIGPNGSGKSTLFNVITGVYRPRRGEVFLGDERVTGQSPSRLNRIGIARTFQNIRLFGTMSVLENVTVGAAVRSRVPIWQELLGLRSVEADQEEASATATEALDAVGLGAKASLPALGLPYGDQKRLEIARALATKPRILLLDEPVAGLDPSERTRMAELISSLHGGGLTVLLIEHDMRIVMGISDRVMVLHYGKKIAEGTPTAVQSNPEVVAAYLGEQGVEEAV